MASNGDTSRVTAPSGGGSMVGASGYKFSEKDTKPGKMKLKKGGAKGKKRKDETKNADANANAPDSPSSSPALPDLDEKTLAAFPTGRPREENTLETVICKHCKKPTLKHAAIEHVRHCLQTKQERARKKKEARDAARAKERGDKGEDEDVGAGNGNAGEKDGDGAMKGQKSAKKGTKGMGMEETKKGKKRKTEAGDEDKDKEPKKKKKKDEPKPKVAKPKGPVDVEKQCGVPLPNGGQCARSLTCKSHSMGAKRSVPGRSLPYDMLLQAYQKKNQARQQKAAIDANAPLQDEFENNGPVDSDEEKDNVMAAIGRSNPEPLASHSLVSTKKKYQFVRIKETLAHALGGARGGGLFSTGDSAPAGGNIFQPADSMGMAAPVFGQDAADAGKTSVTASS